MDTHTCTDIAIAIWTPGGVAVGMDVPADPADDPENDLTDRYSTMWINNNNTWFLFTYS